MRRLSLFALVCSVVLAASVPAVAIVTRHDRDDREYRELARLYPQAATIMPDGSGVLIAPRWVLTAAHVARGVSHRDPRVEVAGREYAVARIFIHPDWKSMPHDIALFELVEPVEGVAPAKLYRDDDEVGQTVVFVGRGDTGTGLTGPERADRIARGATNVVDRADDDWIHFDFDEGEAGTHLEGVSGPGDSGGPALVTRDGDVYTLGVSVFADGKGKGPGRYGVLEGYTRVSTHADWIDAVLAGERSGDGFVPGASPGRREARRGAGGARAVGVPIGGSAELPSSPAARLVEEYLRVYNSDDPAGMAAYIEASFAPAYRATKTEEEHLATYRRLFDEHFGKLSVRSVIEATDEAVKVLCSSEKGPMAEFRFQVTGGADARLDGIRVAIVEID